MIRSQALNDFNFFMLFNLLITRVLIKAISVTPDTKGGCETSS